MEKIVQWILEKKYLLLCGVLFLLVLIMGGLYFQEAEAKEAFHCPSEVVSTNEEKEVEEEKTQIQIDVKGAVLKPGVYLMEKGQVVNDAIQKAGGLAKDAETKNLNLSKKLVDEMVIYVYTKKEFEQLKDELPKTDAAIDVDEDNDAAIDHEKKQDTNTIPGKISLNTATLEELMTLPGIGEAKAKSIIEYRKTCGAFKKIEDIKNISDIGDAVYSKLKDYITV